jgi:hypothetical protein
MYMSGNKWNWWDANPMYACIYHVCMYVCMYVCTNVCI